MGLQQESLLALLKHAYGNAQNQQVSQIPNIGSKSCLTNPTRDALLSDPRCLKGDELELVHGFAYNFFVKLILP